MNDLLAFAAIVSKHWAIMPDMLETICRISLREGEGVEAVAKRLGRPLENTRSVSVRDGVAIIPVTGPIFPRANTLSQISSGATSLQVLSDDLHTAVDNPDISGVLLEIDSPGGVAFGPAEMAELIRDASKTKPVTAYVSGLSASAAYWIASGASEIVAHRSAMLGSIGVVTAMSVQESAGMDGRRTIEIVSSNARNKRPDVSTDEGKAVIRAELDAIEAQFIGAIAAFRGVSVEKVISDFGQGGILSAEKAVAVGMADRIGTFEEVLAGLSGKVATHAKGGNTMNTHAPSTAAPEKPITATAPAEDALTAARAEGAKAERERISGIESVSIPGFEALVSAAKADGESTGADVALAIVSAQKKSGQDHLSALADAEKSLPEIRPSADVSTTASSDTSAPIGERCKAKWDKDPGLRAEFGEFAAYLAFQKNAEAGNIKIFGQK